jgi:hypothetical protein
MFACPATDDFFRSRIDHMIDLRHPLAVLASRMPWQEIEARVPGWICSLNTTGSSGGCDRWACIGPCPALLR